jgi:serine protease Do
MTTIDMSGWMAARLRHYMGNSLPGRDARDGSAPVPAKANGKLRPLGISTLPARMRNALLCLNFCPSTTRIRAAAHRVALSVIASAILAPGSCGIAMAAAPACACDSAAVVDQALPAVVNIRVAKVVHVRGAAAGKPELDRFEPYSASGFVIDPSGVIATNEHVVKDAAAITVVFSDGSHTSARLIGAAALMDFALLKVAVSKPLPVLRFGDSDALRVAEPVIAIGNPLGLGTSVSTGVVSALNRTRNTTPFGASVQTDAAINPGDSGGPLLDCTGVVIGIDTSLISNAKVLGSIGLGFALPSDSVKFAVGKLLNRQTSGPNWIGVHLQDLTPWLGTIFGYSTTTGAIVTGTDPDSPAADAPLDPGDIITAANGRQMHDASDVMQSIVMQPLEAPIVLSVWRAGHSMELVIRGHPWPHIAALRSDVLASAASIVRARKAGLGLHLTKLTAAYRRRLGLTGGSGVLIDRVTPGSQANHVGLIPGEIIGQIDERPARTPQDVMGWLAHATRPVALLVRDKTVARWVLLYLGRIDVRDLITRLPAVVAATGASNVDRHVSR